MEYMVGRKLGRYFLIRYLARGGMSEIYLALDEQYKQMYALKLVPQFREEHAVCLDREIQMLLHFKHPHVLPLLDYGATEDILYSVMPYIAHGTLKDRIARGPLSVDEADTLLAQIADALQCLHDAGFVHRDVKSANVLHGESTHIWLADFGLVMQINGRDTFSAADCLIGTPSYMAPELADARASSGSDTYALGVVLYEMVTGRVPFDGKTPQDIYCKQMYELPPLPTQWNPSLPPALEQVLLCALEKDPRDRYASPQALARAYHQACLYRTSVPSHLLASRPVHRSTSARRKGDHQRRYGRRGTHLPTARAAMARLTRRRVQKRRADPGCIPALAINATQTVSGPSAEPWRPARSTFPRQYLRWFAGSFPEKLFFLKGENASLPHSLPRI
ncbi:MAG TPA: serine/threonine-protein kinase [Ktedonobacteraceae bacterium]|jgi:serine/threonine-protein kinase